MTDTTPSTKIVRATDADGFGREFRIREDGVTEAREMLDGEALSDWKTTPEFQNTKTLGGVFQAPEDLDHIVRSLNRKLGTKGNWQTVEIVDADESDARVDALAKLLAERHDKVLQDVDNEFARQRAEEEAKDREAGADSARRRVDQTLRYDGSLEDAQRESKYDLIARSKAYTEAYEAALTEGFRTAPPYRPSRDEAAHASYKSGVKTAAKLLHLLDDPANADRERIKDFVNTAMWKHTSLFPKKYRGVAGQDLPMYDAENFEHGLANGLWDLRHTEPEAPTDPNVPLPNADDLLAEHARAIATAEATPDFDEPEPDRPDLNEPWGSMKSQVWHAWRNRRDTHDEKRAIPAPPITVEHNDAEAKAFVRGWERYIPTYQRIAADFDFDSYEVSRDADHLNIAFVLKPRKWYDTYRHFMLRIGARGKIQSFTKKNSKSGSMRWTDGFISTDGK